MIGEDKVEAAKLALRAAAQAFDESVVHESHFIIWKEDEARRTVKALGSLSKLNFKVIQSGHRKVRADGTGKWLLANPKFQEWLKPKQRCLWCPGLREYHVTPFKVELTSRSWGWKNYLN